MSSIYSKEIVDEFLKGWLEPCFETLEGVSSLGYHVVFERGTVVRIEFNSGSKVAEDEGTEWDGKMNAIDFPEHRIDVETIESIRKQLGFLAQALDEDLKEDPDLLRVTKKAIGILVGDGYPYPGGPPSDRNPFPLPVGDEEKQATLVVWPHRHPAIISFVSSSMAKDSAQAAAVAGEARRLDGFLFFPFAVIGPDLKVTEIALPTFEALKKENE